MAATLFAQPRLTRRHLLGQGLTPLLGLGGVALGDAAAAAMSEIAQDHVLVFPRDHGAHPGARIEWWYATGWLQSPRAAPGAGGGGGAAAGAGTGLFGFQLTFFRSRTGVDNRLPGRFVPRQLLFAHAALTDIAGQRHLHAQRLDRWAGPDAAAGQPPADSQKLARARSSGTALASATPQATPHITPHTAPLSTSASSTDTAVALGPWTLRRDAAPDLGANPARYRARLAAPDAGFTLDLTLQATQPLLLQGQAGWSQKGPLPAQASHYYSQPQLAVNAVITLAGQPHTLAGRGWLDHEWSDALLAPGAVGWDWIGINLADGGALTAFVLRRADGSALWAGGSHRPAGGAVLNFAPSQVVFEPLQVWRSPDTGIRYPVHWRIVTPLGAFELHALLHAQELDSLASTGTVYWEGLAELLAPGGARIGLGYLEMTGRGAALKLGR